MACRTRASALCAALLLAAPAWAETISPAASARARAAGVASVIVALRPPDVSRAACEPAARLAAIERRRAAVLAELAPDEAQVEHAYRTAPGFAGRVTAAGLERLAANPDVLRVDLDPIGRAAAEDNMTQIRADRVRARGVTGFGVTIAVIDTGVEADHPDVFDALVHEECFCRGGRLGDHTRRACCPGGAAHASGPGSARSVDSHGPHVTGIALSRGRVAPVGVAPGAQLVAIRVLDTNNEGFISDWVAALDWIAAERPDVRVVNMSLVSDHFYTGDCGHGCGNAEGCAANLMLADVIEQLAQRGTLVVAAAGNEGLVNAMTAPACIAQAVAVGAVNGDDTIASFSNRSEELDLFAPGVDVVSDGLGGTVETMSGTSMAAPHATGVAALLMSARPDLGAAEIQQLLRDSGAPVFDEQRQESRPRIDAFAALNAAMRGAALERGSGSRGSDCLLEWHVMPPEIVQRRGWPLITCRDNDPTCDADHELGRCTFVYSPCFKMHDPLLRACSVAEPLTRFAINSPPADAPLGSVDRINVDYLASALPDIPFADSDHCGDPIPFIVYRSRAAGPGFAHIRMSVATPTRRDYDHLVFECLPPE